MTSDSERVAHLTAVLHRVQQLLDVLEWSLDGVCPSCMNDSSMGHEADCELKQGQSMMELVVKKEN